MQRSKFVVLISGIAALLAPQGVAQAAEDPPYAFTRCVDDPANDVRNSEQVVSNGAADLRRVCITYGDDLVVQMHTTEPQPLSSSGLSFRVGWDNVATTQDIGDGRFAHWYSPENNGVHDQQVVTWETPCKGEVSVTELPEVGYEFRVPKQCLVPWGMISPSASISDQVAPGEPSDYDGTSEGAFGVLNREVGGYSVSRLAGQDRYDTATAVSAETFPTGATEAFVVTGENFPDALAAGPAAARLGAPVLPIAATRIPPVIAAELQRLKPNRITVLGGPAAVSESLYSELQSYAPVVRRVAGADRYQTAAAVVRDAFTGVEPDWVIVAPGLTFAEAVAGGGTGAAIGAPLLLTPDDRVTKEAREALAAIGANLGAVLHANPRPGLIDELEPLLKSEYAAEIAWGGLTAIQTAAKLPYWLHYLRDDPPYGDYETASDMGDTVYLTTASTFPDGLAGAPAVAKDKSVLLLMRPDCMPRATAVELGRRRPAHVVVLGGPAAISDAAASSSKICT